MNKQQKLLILIPVICLLAIFFSLTIRDMTAPSSSDPELINEVKNESDDQISYQTEGLIAAAESINVSRYPANFQQTYEVFVDRCSKCHALRDSTYSKEILPSYWEQTVQDMMARPNSGISQSEGAAITEFLIYDSATRRKKVLQKQLEELSEGERAAEQKKIDRVLRK